MGSEQHYADEAPVRRVHVDGFWMDPFPVTNERFEQFVHETGYVTTAELTPSASDGQPARPDRQFPGSLVFDPPSMVADLRTPVWWHFRRGADWRHPVGPASSVRGLASHPVVHVSYADALAFAKHYGAMLPTEAEWEFAARGGLDGAEYAWGPSLMPSGKCMANFWQGDFPCHNTLDDGYYRTSPVNAFPANAYGLHDMIGNVWEWTSDWYRPTHPCDKYKDCCTRNPRCDRPEESYDLRPGAAHVPRKVVKGGSHLSAPNYCRRYRPAARQPEPVHASSCHVGFRCIVRATIARV